MNRQASTVQPSGCSSSKIFMKLQKLLFLTLFIVASVYEVIAQPNDGRGQGVRPTTITQLPSQNKRWALIVGVNKYSDKQISSLSGAEHDAKALADALVQYAGFPKDQVILLTTAEPEGRQPKRSTILKYLSNLRGLVPKDGLLLLSFAGHGMERGGKAYLLPADAVSADDVALLEDTAISVDRVRGLIKSTEVKQVMFLLDACRNDPAAGRAEAPNLMTDAYRKGFDFSASNREVEAFVTLYATAIGQRAYEYDEKSQGYFTWTLIEGLKGGAANPRGEVTLGALKKYIEENVPRFVQRDLGASKQQRPFAIIEGYRADDLILGVVVPKNSPASNNSSASEVKPQNSANSDPNSTSIYDSLVIKKKPSLENPNQNANSNTLQPLEVIIAQRDINEILKTQKVEFRTATDQLTSNGKDTLSKIMDVIKLHLVSVEIAVHTDNMGNNYLNLELSQRRAETCREYIIQYLSKKDRVTARGYGETKPVASNDTAEGRAANRRVEFKVLGEYKGN
jgi:outer membrane protein OmpA-like peptidoglycan-associated protein